jgi:hypothetical protein
MATKRRFWSTSSFYRSTLIFLVFMGQPVGAQLPCTCPLAYKGGGENPGSSLELAREGTRTPLEPSQSRPRLSQALNNTTYNGVGYYTPTARTTLNPRVLLCSPISSGKP